MFPQVPGILRSGAECFGARDRKGREHPGPGRARPGRFLPGRAQSTMAKTLTATSMTVAVISTTKIRFSHTPPLTICPMVT
jgi:hypothetical protein